MQIDEVRTTWKELDRQLAAQSALSLRTFRELKMDHARTGLRAMTARQIGQAVFGAVIALLSAPFWIEHTGDVSLMVSGLALHAYGIAVIITSLWQIVQLERIDVSAPVVQAQRQVARLRSFRARSALVLGLPWWVLWALVLVVVAQSVAGVNLWVSTPDWMVWNIAIGIVGAVASVWAARRFGNRLGSDGRMRRITDALAGRTIATISHQLDEIGRFESEAHQAK